MADFTVNNQGSIIGITPLNQKAREWIDANVDVPPCHIGIPVWGDHRMMATILEAMWDAGLVSPGMPTRVTGGDA